MRPAMTARGLYCQLTHFLRLVDANRLLRRVPGDAERIAAEGRLAPIRPALDAAAEAVLQAQSRSAYKWVDLNRLCSVEMQ